MAALLHSGTYLNTFSDKNCKPMVKLGSSAGVGAGVDLKEKEEVKGGHCTYQPLSSQCSDVFLNLFSKLLNIFFHTVEVFYY